MTTSKLDKLEKEIMKNCREMKCKCDPNCRFIKRCPYYQDYWWIKVTKKVLTKIEKLKK